MPEELQRRAPGSAGQPIRVVLVEDNPGDARLIGEMLSEVDFARFDLEWVDRLEPALQRLSVDSTDLVLLDLGLPDSQGIGTLTRVLSQAPRLPVIVLTSLDDRDLAVQAIREGAKDYLVKGKVDSYLLGRALLRHLPASPQTGGDSGQGAAD
jgi:DNA-binding response OmpR family regulator